MRGKIALLLAVLAAASVAQSPQRPDPMKMIGKKAPELAVKNWLNTGGKALAIGRLKGKAVLLDFWAYW
jgi:hypothetical protein